jgi:cellulose 1,4-beta-cellobiosidase
MVVTSIPTNREIRLSTGKDWQSPHGNKPVYVQGGKIIPISQSTIANVTGNSIATAYCDAYKAAFGDNYSFKTDGGMASMSSAMSRGMTLGELSTLWLRKL